MRRRSLLVTIATTPPAMSTWNFKIGEKEHTVVLNRGLEIRDPMYLVVDGKKIADLQIPKDSFLPKLQYSFICGGREMTLLVYAERADIVFGNKSDDDSEEIQSPTQNDILTEKSIPIWCLVLLTLVNFVAPVFIGKNYFAWISAISTSILMCVNARKPSCSNFKKIFIILALLSLNLVISFGFYLLGVS